MVYISCIIHICVINGYSVFPIALYEYVHQGHCAGGWVSPNSIQGTILDCRNECAGRSAVEYFAYNDAHDACACYTQCPDDNHFNDYNAYRIIGEGKI